MPAAETELSDAEQETAGEAFLAEVKPQYGALRCPTAILWESDDPWFPISRGMALAERAGVTLTPLTGPGYPPLPDALDVALRELVATFPDNQTPSPRCQTSE